MSGHYYFVKKLKILEKQLGKVNCSYGKVSHALNQDRESFQKYTVETYLILPKLRFGKNFAKMIFSLVFCPLSHN